MITGDLPQNKRIALIKRIKAGQIKALVATDVASRGIHIADITHVYNFDIPDDAANYIHRIGRTARAGAKGASYSLICEEYASNFLAVQELLGDMVPKSVWHDEKYLAVEDRSGNPFEDNFGKRVEAQPERYGDRSRSYGEARGRRPEREERDGRHQAGISRRPETQMPAKERTSVLSMIKRFFVLLWSFFSFGKKKDSKMGFKRGAHERGHRRDGERGRNDRYRRNDYRGGDRGPRQDYRGGNRDRFGGRDNRDRGSAQRDRFQGRDSREGRGQGQRPSRHHSNHHRKSPPRHH